MDSPASCRQPVALRQTTKVRPPPLPIAFRQLPERNRSKSRSMTFVVTLARASLQIRAAGLSTPHPRRPKTPARYHAARWWSNGSIWRPHRHTRDVRGRTRRKRRRRRILNNWGSNCSRGHVGTHDSGAPVMGPLCDHYKACSWLAKRGINTSSRTPVQFGLLHHAATLV